MIHKIDNSTVSGGAASQTPCFRDTLPNLAPLSEGSTSTLLIFLKQYTPFDKQVHMHMTNKHETTHERQKYITC